MIPKERSSQNRKGVPQNHMGMPQILYIGTPQNHKGAPQNHISFRNHSAEPCC